MAADRITLGDAWGPPVEAGVRSGSLAAPLPWADELADLPAPSDSTHAGAAAAGCLIAVGSGKGGVGKTVVSSSIAATLAATSAAEVLAIDVDLGGANLHNGLGVPRPEFALNRFILEGSPLAGLAAPTAIPGLRLIGGASDIVGLSEFSTPDRQRFLAELRALRSEVTVLDLGAGSSLFNLDLFCLADQRVLVSTGEPTAVQNAYGFLRAAAYRSIFSRFRGEAALQEMIQDAMNHRGEETPSIPSLVSRIARYNRQAAANVERIAQQMSAGLVVNMTEPRWALEVAEKMARLVREYLGARLDFLGAVPRDDAVPRSIREWRTLVIDFPRAGAARTLKAVAGKLTPRLRSKLAPEQAR